MQSKTTILNLPPEEFVHPGTRACSGCGLSIAYRVGLKALGKDTILVVPPAVSRFYRGFSCSFNETALPECDVRLYGCRRYRNFGQPESTG